MLHQKIEYEEVIVCLFDGGFDLGFAALANSLVKNKFRGIIHVGYRGRLPAWVKQLEQIKDDSFSLSKEITITFTPVFTDMHLGFYKPHFIKQTFQAYSTCSRLFYFDADIVVNASWNLFSNWLDKGVCLCLDNNFHYIHHNHPWRKDWRHLGGDDHARYNNTDQYFNSGFLAIDRSSAELIDTWISLTQKFIEIGGETNHFSLDPNSSFKGDQDLLNAAITICPDIEINSMGKEAMGFTLPATLMLHAIGKVKPWKKGFLKHLVKVGHTPTMAEKMYFNFSNYPISVFPLYKYKIKRLDLVSASFFGRLLG